MDLLQNYNTSLLEAARAMLICSVGTSAPGGMGDLQVPTQPHIQRDRNAHHDQCAQTQDQEPPDHPHSKFRIADEDFREGISAA
jgi:hypothetical protein